jgi:hypothetical protein
MTDRIVFIPKINKKAIFSQAQILSFKTSHPPGPGAQEDAGKSRCGQGLT